MTTQSHTYANDERLQVPVDRWPTDPVAARCEPIINARYGHDFGSRWDKTQHCFVIVDLSDEVQQRTSIKSQNWGSDLNPAFYAEMMEAEYFGPCHHPDGHDSWANQDFYCAFMGL